MAATVFLSPAALEDIECISDHIRQDNRDAAHRFLSAAERLFELLAVEPGIGETVAHSEYPLLRYRTLSRRFRNYVVFYQPQGEGVQIVRVLHGAQELPRILRS